MNAEHSKRSESELLGKIFAGDDAAFHSLFSLYNKKLTVFAYKMLGEQESARDLVQEVWIRIIEVRRTAQKNEVQHASAYLFRIARNLCIDKLRARKEHLRIDELAEEDHPDDSVAEHTPLEEIVTAALDKLSYDDKELLVMHSYLGYAYEEIAEMQAKTAEAIWTRASRIRAKLREIIRSAAHKEGIDIVGQRKIHSDKKKMTA